MGEMADYYSEGYYDNGITDYIEEEESAPYFNTLQKSMRHNNYDKKGYRTGIDPDLIYSVKIRFNNIGTSYTFMMYGRNDNVKFSTTKKYSQASASDMVVQSWTTGREAMQELAATYDTYGKITMFQPDSAPSYWDHNMAAGDLMEYIRKELRKKEPIEFIPIW